RVLFRSRRTSRTSPWPSSQGGAQGRGQGGGEAGGQGRGQARRGGGRRRREEAGRQEGPGPQEHGREEDRSAGQVTITGACGRRAREEGQGHGDDGLRTTTGRAHSRCPARSSGSRPASAGTVTE